MLIDIPPYLVKQCELYACRRGSDAVFHVLSDYPNQVKTVRDLTARLSDFDNETLAFDDRLDSLRLACKKILDL